MKKSYLSKQQRKSIVQLAVIWGLVENHYSNKEFQATILELMKNYLYRDKPEGERYITTYDRVMIDDCIKAVENYGKNEKVQPTPAQVLAIADIITYEHLLFVKDRRKELWQKIQDIVLNDKNYIKVDIEKCEISESIYGIIEKETNKTVTDYTKEIIAEIKELKENEILKEELTEEVKI